MVDLVGSIRLIFPVSQRGLSVLTKVFMVFAVGGALRYLFE